MPLFLLSQLRVFVSRRARQRESKQMNLPNEIWLQVGSHLGRSNYRTCIQVSKAWYNIFAPWIYQTVDLRPNPHRRLLKDDDFPSVSQIQRHGQNIRNLTLCLPCHLINPLVLSVTMLKSLHVLSSYEINAGPFEGVIETGQLLLNNPGVQHLRLDYTPSPSKWQTEMLCS
jgi:hypothetical protein